ncbi:hypothetical protein [Novosphingobium sp. Gsoil 351]|uniref:hypothetical protein n=1 Tax=Novosphingobium sp. Gsoil 351 TaxID=2675225 RepID=UPI001E3A92B5
MTQMRVDGVVTAIRSGDFGNGAVDVAHGDRDWLDPYDRALHLRLYIHAAADLDIMGSARRRWPLCLQAEDRARSWTAQRRCSPS